MALTADEQKILDELMAKQNAPAEPQKFFNDVYDILEFLVHHSTAFSGNEELRQEAKDVITHAQNPNASEETVNGGEAQ